MILPSALTLVPAASIGFQPSSLHPLIPMDVESVQEKDLLPLLCSSASTHHHSTAEESRNLPITLGSALRLHPALMCVTLPVCDPFFCYHTGSEQVLLGSPTHPVPSGGQCPSRLPPSSFSQVKQSPMQNQAPLLSPFFPFSLLPSLSLQLFHPLRTLCFSLWDPL